MAVLIGGNARWGAGRITGTGFPELSESNDVLLMSRAGDDIYQPKARKWQ